MRIYKHFENFTMNNFMEDIYPTSEAFADRFQDAVMGKGFYENVKK